MLRELFSHQAWLEATVVPIQLMLALFGMGATLSLADFAKVFRNPKALAIGIVAQLVVVPLVAVAFVELFGLQSGWAVGLLLVSVVPGGAFSNILTFFARGNVPLSISVTTVTTVGCVATIPFILGLAAGDYLPTDFVFPAKRIIIDIGLFLILPLIGGMVVYRFLPTWASKISIWSVRLSMLLVLVLTVSSLGSGRINLAEYGFGPPLIILLFTVVIAFLSPHLFRLFSFSDDVGVALSIEVTLRNVGIGLLLVKFFFPDSPEENGKVLFTCLFFAGLATPLCLPMLFRHRRGKSPAFLRKPHPPENS